MVRKTDFWDYWTAVRLRLDEELAHYIPRLFSQLPGEQVATILRLLEGGKQIRGCLTCLTSDALGGRIEDAIPRAIAIECIQAASLIHDDYVDGDAVRRDRSALWLLEGARKAVLLGDVVFATALRYMAEIGREDGLVTAEALAAMAQGAYQEFLVVSDSANGAARRSEPYDAVIQLKTGALFGAAAKLGAIAASSSPRLRDRAYEFGARLGEAYQIADDVRDLVVLDAGEETTPAKLAALALILRRFLPRGELPTTSLLDGTVHDIQLRLQSFRSDLQVRMDDEIGVRLDLARKAVKEFPENRAASMLRAAPAQIMQMIGERTSIE